MTWKHMRTAPKDGTSVLLYYRALNQIYQAHWDGEYWRTSGGGYRHTPAAWMAIPSTSEGDSFLMELPKVQE